MKNGKTSLILPVLIIVAVASLALFWWLAPLRNVSSGREAAHSGETSRSLSLSERWLRDERKRAIAMAVQALVEKGTWNDTTALALNADPLAREAAAEYLEWLEMGSHSGQAQFKGSNLRGSRRDFGGMSVDVEVHG